MGKLVFEPSRYGLSFLLRISLCRHDVALIAEEGISQGGALGCRPIYVSAAVDFGFDAPRPLLGLLLRIKRPVHRFDAAAPDFCAPVFAALCDVCHLGSRVSKVMPGPDGLRPAEFRQRPVFARARKKKGPSFVS